MKSAISYKTVLTKLCNATTFSSIFLQISPVWMQLLQELSFTNLSLTDRINARLPLLNWSIRFVCFVQQLPEVEVGLDDPKATIFSYVQKVALAAGISKNERVRRVWEPTYTYVFFIIWKLPFVRGVGLWVSPILLCISCCQHTSSPVADPGWFKVRALGAQSEKVATATLNTSPAMAPSSPLTLGSCWNGTDQCCAVAVLLSISS